MNLCIPIVHPPGRAPLTCHLPLIKRATAALNQPFNPVAASLAP